MTSRPLPFRATPSRPSRDRLRARWGAGAVAAALTAGVGLAAAPVAGVVAIAVTIGAAVFVAWPVVVLIGIVLTRASLDVTAELAVLGGEANLAGALGAGTFAAGGLALLLARSRLPARSVSVPFLGLLALGAVSLLYTPDVSAGALTLLRLAAVFVVFCIAALAIRRKRDLDWLVAAVLASALVPIAVGLVQLVTGSTQSRQGFSSIAGTFLFPNGYALFLLVIIAVGIVAFFEASTVLRRTLIGALLALSGVCLVMTYARASWIGFVLVLALLAALGYRRLVPVAAGVLVLTAVAVPSSVGVVEERFSDLSSASARYSDNSWTWRLETWGRMLPYAAERSLTGHGFASFPALSVREFGTSNEEFPIEGADDGLFAHNDYLSMAVELGVPGLALWAATLIGLAVIMWRARASASARPYANALFAVACALLVISAIDNVQAYTAVLYYVMALAGGIAGVAFHAPARGTPAPSPSSARQATG